MVSQSDILPVSIGIQNHYLPAIFWHFMPGMSSSAAKRKNSFSIRSKPEYFFKQLHYSPDFSYHGPLTAHLMTSADSGYFVLLSTLLLSVSFWDLL
jgi:hypothetical protein